MAKWQDINNSSTKNTEHLDTIDIQKLLEKIVSGMKRCLSGSEYFLNGLYVVIELILLSLQKKQQ